MKITARISLITLDKRGYAVTRTSFPARSYLKALDELLKVHMCGGNTTIKDRLGVNRTISGSSYSFYAHAGDNFINWGLRVGTGDTAVALADFKLDVPIVSGNGAGQLYHQPQTFAGPTTLGTTRYFTIARHFNNNSGGDVTVKEVGVYVRLNNLYEGCLERSLVPGGHVVLNTGVLVLQYTIGITV